MHLIVSLFVDLFVGAAAGWLITRFMDMDSSNMLFNCVLGLCGGIVAGILGRLVGIGATNIIGSIIMAVIGGCLAVAVYRKLIKS